MKWNRLLRRGRDQPPDVIDPGAGGDPRVEIGAVVTPGAPGPAVDADTAGGDGFLESVILDLRVLLLSAGDGEASALAWQARLEGDGIPYDHLIAGVHPLTPSTLESTNGHGRYVAVILATDALVRLRDGLYESSLGPQEWTDLRTYLRDFGVRQISAYATPGPGIGLQPPSWAGDVDHVVGQVTEPGRAVFPELVGPVPLSAGTYGFRTAIADSDAFTTLVEGTAGSPMVGVFRHADGREEMVITVASGPSSRHMALLGHGMVSWAVRHRSFGHHGYFLSAQVDDVFLGSTVPAGAAPLRLDPADVAATVRWSQRRHLRLDLVFNGWGSVRAIDEEGADELTDALVTAASEFNWVNHTFGHLDLDQASEATIDDEMVRNLEWAADHGLPVPVDVLVTGAHSGLDNPAMATVTDRRGLKWIACDASRTPRTQPLAGAQLVPRHPVNIPLDVSTREDLVRKCGGAHHPAVNASDPLAPEVALVLTHVLSNDPRPHYTHQNALVGDRLLLALLDDVIDRFRSLVDTAPVQLTLPQAGQELLRRAAWAKVVERRAVRVTMVAGRIKIYNRTNSLIEVPYRKSEFAARWVAVPGGHEVVLG